MTNLSYDSLKSQETVPTPGEVATASLSTPGTEPIRYACEIFPQEIYFGDPVYVVFFAANDSDEKIIAFSDIVKNSGTVDISSGGATLDISDANVFYQWIPEKTETADRDSAGAFNDLEPRDQRIFSLHRYEFPPLEDLETPFGQYLMKNATERGIDCEIRVKLFFRNSQWKDVAGEHVQKIRIKSRPNDETQLLTRWRQNTPLRFFPKVVGHYKVPYYDNSWLNSSVSSRIRIGSQTYDPWAFIRFGNRKPSIPNNPTTLSGWRDLESQLSPSTMRDEVRLTRLQLEYYSAAKGDASETAKNELVAWLKSLPRPQRIVMAKSTISSNDRLRKTPLESKSYELRDALQKLLDEENSIPKE